MPLSVIGEEGIESMATNTLRRMISTNVRKPLGNGVTIHLLSACIEYGVYGETADFWGVNQSEGA